jgi:hypothetical protein
MAATVLLSAHPVQAAVLATQTVQVVSHDGVTGDNVPLTLAKYSGSGTVTEVDFSVTGSMFASGFMTNTGNAPESFEILVSGSFIVQATAGGPTALLNLHALPSNATFDVFGGLATIQDQIFTDLPANGFQFLDLGLATNTVSAAFNAPGDVSGFVGNGSFSLVPGWTEVRSTIAISHNPLVGEQFNSSDSASITVTYLGDASPPPPTEGVPETSTWALLICGFGAVGARLRHRPVVLAA